MPLITKKEITELSNVNHENCISIFIPTHTIKEVKGIAGGR